MSIATLANAPTGYRASSRHSLGEIVTRFLTWRLERQLQAIEPAELEALQHAAQEFAAFSSRACLRAGEIRVRCAQSLSAAARSTIGAVRAQLGKAQLRFCLRAMANALLAFGVTLGGGKINNPGRYLVLLPPINGATAVFDCAPA